MPLDLSQSTTSSTVHSAGFGTLLVLGCREASFGGAGDVRGVAVLMEVAVVAGVKVDCIEPPEGPTDPIVEVVGDS